MKNTNKSRKRLTQEKKTNPTRSDFKTYQFGRDDGRITLESQRMSAVVKRRNRNKKWRKNEPLEKERKK